jgi:hypothetical protein
MDQRKVEEVEEREWKVFLEILEVVEASTTPAAEEVRAAVVYLVLSSMTQSTMAGKLVSAVVYEERRPMD